jgi:hypothetical protein
MKKFFILIPIAIGIYSCSSKKNIPDVSAIKVGIKTQRFEKDFFSIDTNNISPSLDSVNTKHPSFLLDYLFNIMAMPSQPDSVIKYTHLFLSDSLYHSLYIDAEKKFSSFDIYEKQIKKGLQFVKYYFPKYKIPTTIVTFIGPVDGVATALGSEHEIAIGLQGYMGKDYPAYQTEYISQVYPSYKSRRFEPDYIVVNCIKNIIEEMYSNKSNGKPLVEQMIEAGKRLYVLDALLPETADSLKTGYTKQQLDNCYKNEKTIWTFFVQNDLLYQTESNLIGGYVNDGPNTPEISSEAPAFLGQFTGWQIVKKWMEKNKKKTLEELMQTNAKTIFEEAKYKP